MPDRESKKIWDNANTYPVRLKLNRHTDADIIEKLDSVDNKQGYIKDLIRQDISRDDTN